MAISCDTAFFVLFFFEPSVFGMSRGCITETILINIKALCDVSGKTDEVITTASAHKINVFWHVTPCSLKGEPEVPDESVVSIFKEGQPNDIHLIFLQ
jgi:hypothetical protein